MRSVYKQIIFCMVLVQCLSKTIDLGTEEGLQFVCFFLALSQPSNEFMIIYFKRIYEKRDDFDFDIVNFPFLDVTFPVLPLTGFIFLNLFGLLEYLVMWLISMPVIKV